MPKQSNALARIRQTCCLGISPEELVPQILEEMHQIIPSERNHFAWTDDVGNIVNAYFEKPDPVLLDWLRHNQHRFEEEIGISVRQAILFGKVTGNFRWPFRKGAEASESYDRMFRAQGIQFCLDGVLRDRDRPLGQIVMFRQPKDGDFNGEEERVLAHTLPYIAHAISSPVKTPETFVETGDSGLMVFDANGRITYQSHLAKELCVYALHERIPVGHDIGLDIRVVEAGLRSLFQQVLANFSDSDAAVSPPAWTLKNKWGEFQVRAYALQEAAGATRSYGVTVEKKIPAAVLMLKKIKQMPLSNRQREVCFHLARGVGNEDIATMLGISATTLKEHTQAIYRKLAIEKREDLIRMVLT